MVNHSSTLQKAMDHHGKGEKKEAIKLYKEFLDGGNKDKRAYTNLAALLRSEGNADEALKIVKTGLRECGENSPILLNTLGNCFRDLNQNCEAIVAYRKAIKFHKGYFDPQISLVGTLHDMGLKNLSDKCLFELFKFYGVDKKAILHQIISREVENSNQENRAISKNLDVLIDCMNEMDGNDENVGPNHWFILSQLCGGVNKIDEAERYYDKGVVVTREKLTSTNKKEMQKKVKEIYTIASWNFACQLLRHGRMKLGWKLYEHGLNAPADGAQKWQRALFKPFSYSKVKPWRGEDLSNKTILLLGEQGIGDTMAFLTLINPVIEQAKSVHLIVPARLHNIYTRTLSQCVVYADKDTRDKQLDENIFDYQCALGSIPQYIYQDLKSFQERSFQLRADDNKTQLLKDKYLQGTKQTLIGISWQGGGRKDRIKHKSIELTQLLKSLKPYDIKILSLQYGDDNKIVKDAASKLGIDFIDDEEIQATEDMESWLNQVNACDGVLSIANTTIHGAGGLNKPTLCLLGANADWRWLNDKTEKFSYWYPSVEIAWQDQETNNWQPALAKIDTWMRSTIGV